MQLTKQITIVYDFAAQKPSKSKRKVLFESTKETTIVSFRGGLLRNLSASRCDQVCVAIATFYIMNFVASDIMHSA